MTFTELKARIQVVLQTIDKLSATGVLDVKGISSIQSMAGCVAILEEITSLDELEANAE